MSEKENVYLPNRFRIVPNKSKKTLLKTNKELPSCKSIKEKSLKTIADIQYHPVQQFLFGTIPTTEQLKKFANLMYRGLFYSVCSLKGPSQEYLRKKAISLPEPKCIVIYIQKVERSSSCLILTKHSSTPLRATRKGRLQLRRKLKRKASV